MTDKAEEYKKGNAAEAKVEEREVDGKKEYLDSATGEWVGKSELKKRQKARQAAEKAAKKAEEKKAKEEAKAASGGNNAKKAKVEEELDPSKYTENRRAWIQAERDAGRNPYPHKFHRDMTIPQFV